MVLTVVGSECSAQFWVCLMMDLLKTEVHPECGWYQSVGLQPGWKKKGRKEEASLLLRRGRSRLCHRLWISAFSLPARTFQLPDMDSHMTVVSSGLPL